MIEVTTPQPGEDWWAAVQRQAKHNATPGVLEAACYEAAWLQATLICGGPFRAGLVAWSPARMAAFRAEVEQARIRHEFEERRRREPYILVF